MNWSPNTIQYKHLHKYRYNNIKKEKQSAKKEHLQRAMNPPKPTLYILQTIQSDIYYKLYGANHICKAIIMSKPPFIKIFTHT